MQNIGPRVPIIRVWAEYIRPRDANIRAWAKYIRPTDANIPVGGSTIEVSAADIRPWIAFILSEPLTNRSAGHVNRATGLDNRSWVRNKGFPPHKTANAEAAEDQRRTPRKQQPKNWCYLRNL